MYAIRSYYVIEVVEELNGRYYKTNKFPIHREGKKSILAGFTIDITDLKIAEMELIKTKDEIEKLTISYNFV